MSKSTIPASKIDAEDISLGSLLDKQKFTIDYFQREYRWEEKHIEQLIADLTEAFFNDYDVEHEREEVENYNSYYMGPVVMSSKEGRLSIIDGQQRLTTLTLVLIYLNNLQRDTSVKEPIDDMIFSERYGKKSFNMQIEEREECLHGLYSNGEFEIEQVKDESVINLVNRYNDILRFLTNDELDEESLPYFISWIKEKLIFVKIVTYSEENAYTIFETMNDRGLNLTPTDMLKSFLLSKVRDFDKKNEFNTLWKSTIAELHEYGDQNDLAFFRAFFRAKYAETIRPGKKDSENEDYERIGTTFHTWFKEKARSLGIDKEPQYVDFIQNKFKFYTQLYIKIIDAQYKLTAGLERLYYTYKFGIADSLSVPLLMAPINEGDKKEDIHKKLLLVAHFLDCFVVIRSLNQRTINQSSIRYTLFSLVKEIRNKSVDKLAEILVAKHSQFEENLDGIHNFKLNQQNQKFVKYFLSRLTHYVDQGAGVGTDINFYLSDNGNSHPFQIEHIWADIFSRHKDEFDQQNDFNRYRNSLGDLVLLPRGTNQSFNKETYEKKLPHYLKQNLLVQSLHPDCYVKNPNFVSWLNARGFSFAPKVNFKKSDIENRQQLYYELSSVIWSPKVYELIKVSA